MRNVYFPYHAEPCITEQSMTKGLYFIEIKSCCDNSISFSEIDQSTELCMDLINVCSMSIFHIMQSRTSQIYPWRKSIVVYNDMCFSQT